MHTLLFVKKLRYAVILLIYHHSPSFYIDLV